MDNNLNKSTSGLTNVFKRKLIISVIIALTLGGAIFGATVFFLNRTSIGIPKNSPTPQVSDVPLTIRVSSELPGYSAQIVQERELANLLWKNGFQSVVNLRAFQKPPRTFTIVYTKEVRKRMMDFDAKKQIISGYDYVMRADEIILYLYLKPDVFLTDSKTANQITLTYIYLFMEGLLGDNAIPASIFSAVSNAPLFFDIKRIP